MLSVPSQFSETQSNLRLVALGGGTGLSTALAGLKSFVDDGRAHAAIIDGDDSGAVRLATLAAIVTVSDDGGSSGRLRDELNIPAPGDIRSCMVALSEDSTLLARLFRYRFPGDGALGGHSFGNLFLAALTAVTGDFTEAVRLSSEVLASKGHIYPATFDDVRLVAELADGRTVQGESEIGRSSQPIKRLWLEPAQCLPLPEALAEIHHADIITLGPGSLYTSILPNLLVARVAQTIGETDAVKIYVCNLMTQPGETDHFTAHAHLAEIKRYAPEIRFDYVVLNDRSITEAQTARYAAEHSYQIIVDEQELEANADDAEIVRADLLDDGEKVRHSPDKLARTIIGCYQKMRERRAASHSNQPQTQIIAV